MFKPKLIYFTYNEFACKCGCSRNNIDLDFLLRLDRARHLAKIPFIIISGYRCLKHNKEVGGLPTSSHLRGLAVDIKCDNSRKRLKIIKALLEVDFSRIGIAKTFIHVDADPEKVEAIWLYKK